MLMLWVTLGCVETIVENMGIVEDLFISDWLAAGCSE
jgi:hypothetical protein